MHISQKPETSVKVVFLIDISENIVYNINCVICIQHSFIKGRKKVLKNDILKIIDEKSALFSKGQRRIAAYILTHYDKSAYMTASKLGKEVGVSESTVVRFVMELGFDGYPDFQKSLRELIRSKLTAVQRVEVTNNLIGEGDVLEKVLYSDIDKIKRTVEGIDKYSFDEAVKNIVSAKNIYILGMRASSYLAGFLNYSLRMIFDNVRLIQTTSGSETFEQMMNIGKGDVLIAVSFPRYSKSIIKGVEYASKAGADVIALTDSNGSPIAEHADRLLVAQSDMASFADSLVAPMSVINALIVAVSRESQEVLSQRLRRLEEVWDEYNVYDKTGN